MKGKEKVFFLTHPCADFIDGGWTGLDLWMGSVHPVLRSELHHLASLTLLIIPCVVNTTLSR